jgi:hypothetical protein
MVEDHALVAPEPTNFVPDAAPLVGSETTRSSTMCPPSRWNFAVTFDADATPRQRAGAGSMSTTRYPDGSGGGGGCGGGVNVALAVGGGGGAAVSVDAGTAGSGVIVTVCTSGREHADAAAVAARSLFMCPTVRWRALLMSVVVLLERGFRRLGRRRGEIRGDSDRSAARRA